MKIIAPHLVPCRRSQVDHWESVSEYNGMGTAPWVEYSLTGGNRDIHGFFFYVGPEGKSVREFNGPMLAGPHVSFMEVARSAVFHRPGIGDLVPDSVLELAPDDIVVFRGQPMRLYYDPYTRKYAWTDHDHFGRPLSLKEAPNV